MPSYRTKDIRNIALVGHSGSGKTILAEALLVKSGAKGEAGSIERGSTTMDHDPIERSHQHSLDSAIASLDYKGMHLNLIDTAGMRDSDDQIESLGVEMSKRYAESADVVIFCVEPDRPLTDEELRFTANLRSPCIVVRTKADLVAKESKKMESDEFSVSSVSGTGLDDLRFKLSQLAFSGILEGSDIEPALTRARHRNALSAALDELHQFRDSWEGSVETVVAATHLGAATHALEDLIGVVTEEDVLDKLFSDFCVGK